MYTFSIQYVRTHTHRLVKGQAHGGDHVINLIVCDARDIAKAHGPADDISYVTKHFPPIN